MMPKGQKRPRRMKRSAPPLCTTRSCRWGEDTGQDTGQDTDTHRHTQTDTHSMGTSNDWSTLDTLNPCLPPRVGPAPAPRCLCGLHSSSCCGSDVWSLVALPSCTEDKMEECTERRLRGRVMYPEVTAGEPIGVSTYTWCNRPGPMSDSHQLTGNWPRRGITWPAWAQCASVLNCYEWNVL